VKRFSLPPQVQKAFSKLHQIVIADVRHPVDDRLQFSHHHTFRIPKAAREDMWICFLRK
jgi:hypothetical protein